MNSIRFKTKELLRFHFGCHGNQVTIAVRYVADAYCPTFISTMDSIPLKVRDLQSKM